MKILIRNVFGIVFLLLALSVVYFNKILWATITFQSIDFFIYGIGSFFIFINFFQRSGRTLEWFEVFSHELTHTIFALLTFNKIRNFNANSTGNGFVEYQGKSNWIITLSPYCLPIYTIFLCLLYPFLLKGFWNTLDFLIGFSFIFHLRTFWKQLSPQQPDIQVYGISFSYIFILAFNLYYLFTIPLLISKGGDFLFWWKPLFNAFASIILILR